MVACGLEEQSWRQLSCLPQDYCNPESKVFILSQPAEYANTERLDQYVIIISIIFIPLARTWLYVPINLQGRFWKCSVYLNIHLPSKNYDFKSVIKEEECGYVWQLAGSAKWRSSHYQITTDLLLLTHSLWGATSVTVGWDPLDMHSPVSSSLFSLLPILQKWYVLSCSRIHDELGGEGPSLAGEA